MLQTVIHFLSEHWDRKSCLLLGYSGGPDSKALLYALLDAGCLEWLHLAHVDHSWRLESAQEALALEQEAKQLGIPFYVHKIAAQKEDASRLARLAFFASLFEKIPFQALLLAHHAGDAAETVLKRILEGAHLPFVAGMDPVACWKRMNVWRPLLSVPRSCIDAFLKQKNLNPLIDPTNFDPSYLRARMRISILPMLAQSFGKEVADNLSFLGGRCRELKAYLDKRTEGCQLRRGPWGSYGWIADLERIEARYLVQKWLKEESIILSRSSLERLLDAAFAQSANQTFSERVFVDRGVVFFLSRQAPRCGDHPLILAPGRFLWGDWVVEIYEICDSIAPSVCQFDWKTVWSGRFTALASEGVLVTPTAGSAPRHLWNAAKVPAFLRYKIPVIREIKGKVKEFLSGKVMPETKASFKLVFSTCSAPVS